MNERIDNYHYITGYHDGFQGYKKKSSYKQVEQYQKGYEDGMTDRSYRTETLVKEIEDKRKGK